MAHDLIQYIIMILDKEVLLINYVWLNSVTLLTLFSNLGQGNSMWLAMETQIDIVLLMQYDIFLV